MCRAGYAIIGVTATPLDTQENLCQRKMNLVS